MMDFFTPCFKKLPKLLLGGILLLCVAVSCVADGISIKKAEVRASDEGYFLASNFNISLPSTVQQALERGIALYFVSEFSINRSRWYWLDDEVFRNAQTIKLSYNVLTRQYRVSRGNLYRNFNTLDEVLAILSSQHSSIFPTEILRRSNGYISKVINKDGSYTASTRLYLDINQLPKLLQVNALTNADWALSSDWHRWEIKPSDVNRP